MRARRSRTRVTLATALLGAAAPVVLAGLSGQAAARTDPLAAYKARVNHLMAVVDQTPGSSSAEPNQDPGWGAPTGADFPKLGGNLGNDQYSSLTTITPSDVGSLGGAWRTTLEPSVTTRKQQEATPIVSGGRMFVPTAEQDLYAINAASGAVEWKYSSGFSATTVINRRAAAVGDGMVFATFGGEHVVALDQATGAVRWSVQLGDGSYGLPAALVFYDGKLFIGTSNGGQSGGHGTVYELDAADGSVNWSFDGTSGPGWPAGTAATGGADAWMHPAVDPAHGLVYWTLGDPEKRNDGSGRAGQNLYSCTIIALDIATGALKWSYQSVHHDIWDYDNVMAPVLANIHVHGTVAPAVIYGSKTGMMFELNRLTGKPLLPVTEIAVPQDTEQHTWATQPFPSGQAYVPVCPRGTGANQPVPNYPTGCIFTPHRSTPVLTAPATTGGANWGADSFDPKTGLVYLGAAVSNVAETDGTLMPDMFRPVGERVAGRVVALDPRTNQMAWFKDTTYPASAGQGILTTASGLLVQGQIDGQLVIRSVTDGSQLWAFRTGAAINSTPITYSVNGTQYLAVFAGGNTFGGAGPAGTYLWAFKIGGKVAQGAALSIPTRIPVSVAPVSGTIAHDTVTMGRDWNYSTNAPGSTEDLYGQSAMAPDKLTVPVGTAVTFVNPAGNAQQHGATEFFDGTFAVPALPPGQSRTVTFSAAGTYYYNDPDYPQNTGVIVVGSG